MRVVRSALSIVLAIIACPTLAAAQVPVAVAEQRVDVDGDGKLDVVRVSDDATVSVIITGAAADPPWKAFRTTGQRVRRAELTVRRFPRATAILATAEFGALRSREPEVTEVMVLTWRRGRLGQHLLEQIGPQGRDGEWSKHAELTAQGVLRYQSRPGFARCDGNSYLFAELDDFGRKGPQRVAPPVALPDDAAPLPATAEPPPGASADARALAFRFVAASVDAHAEGAADLAPPRELEDGDRATAWRGFSAAGHYVTARQRSAYAVAALRVVARNVGELGVLLDDRAYRVAMPQVRAGEPVWLRFDPPVAAQCASIIVTDVRAGAEISELAVLTELELSANGGAALLVDVVARGGAPANTARQQLRELGDAASAAITAALESTTDDRARHRLREALADLAVRGVALDDAAVEQVVRAFAAPHLSYTQRASYRRALTAIGARAIAPLARLLADDQATRPARLAATAALAEQPDLAAQQALVQALGVGPRWLRKQVAVAIGTRPTRELAGLVRSAEAARGDPGEADLWRAVGAMAHQTGSAVVAVDAMTARLREFAALGYELRHRLLVALAGIDSDTAIAAVEEAWPAGKDNRAIALRRVTVGALAGNRNAAARPLLARAIDDPDPGVRLLAIDAAADGDAPELTDGPLRARLAGDRWPRVRRAAAATLGPRCQREGVADSMYAALDADDDFGVQSTVLATLSDCGEPRVASKLVAVARDAKRSPALRVHALRLLGERKQPELCPLVVEVARAARREAWSKENALRIAAAALGAVASACAGDRGAVDALLDAAQDDAFPEIQIAAVHGLGSICPNGALPVLERASKLEHRGVADAAARSLASCRRQK